MPVMSTLMPIGKKKIQTILGIDPGLADTGYGIITLDNNLLTIIDYGSIQTDKTLSLPQRLQILTDKLDQLTRRHRPDRIAVEELFFCKNVKTALTIGHARGVILLTAIKHGITPLEFTPLQIKQAVTGYGKADKKQIQQMTKAILNLKSIPQPDDALAVAICASNNQINIYGQ